MPPIELDPDAKIEAIGAEVLAALDTFEESSEKLSPEQWSRLNKEYMDFVGARSVSAFERAKSEVTIRHDTSSDVYVLFAKGGKEVELQSPTKTLLAENNRAPAAPEGRSEIKPLHLNGAEIRQLVAFLKTLSGAIRSPAAEPTAFQLHPEVSESHR